MPTGGSETALDTPSAQQSGLKLKANIDVPAGKVVDFVLDFDACKSVVKRGNSGKYNLKPVVTVVPLLSDAGLRVVGYVAPSIASGATSVSVQTNGVPVKATAPDANGLFVLYPVPVGSYTLVVSAPGRVTAVITGVPVVDTAQTIVNSSALRIDPPLATLRPVSGVSRPLTPACVRCRRSAAGPLSRWLGHRSMRCLVASPLRCPSKRRCAPASRRSARSRWAFRAMRPPLAATPSKPPARTR